MPNTKPVGVAFSDPELVAGTTITGATISSSTIASGTLTNASLSVDVAKPAAAGSTRADATTLTASFSWVTGADATKGVVLPAPTLDVLSCLKTTTQQTLY
jgi:hypothetical protein